VTLVHDEAAHTYHWDGVPAVSITDVLAQQGFVDYMSIPASIRDFALLRGREVAQATLLLDEGRLKWSSLRETVEWEGRRYTWTLGRVMAYVAFKKEFKFKPTVREKPLYDPTYGYAGRPDCFGELFCGLGTVQLKCGPVAPWVGLQTAAEDRLLRLAGYDGQKRLGVELRADGTFKATWFKDPTDIRIFLSALAVAKWQEKNR
jgi:hypothetical protein